MPLENLLPNVKLLTWRDIPDQLKRDSEYPSDRKSYDASRVRKALSWAAAQSWNAARSPVKQPSGFAERPFNRQTIKELFDGLRAGELRLKQKTLDNARSACNAIADHYQMPRGIAHTPLSVECALLRALLTSKWDRAALTRGLRYFSYHGINPYGITGKFVDEFFRALDQEFRVANPQRRLNDFIRVWNKCVTNIPEWPQMMLTPRTQPVRQSIDWAEYKALEAAIDGYLATGYSLHATYTEADLDSIGPEFGDDDDELRQPLSPDTIETNKSSLRMVVWALRDVAEKPECLRDLCLPVRFRQATSALTKRAGGVVNRTVMTRANALLRVAKHPGVLSPEELKLVNGIYRKLELRHDRFMQTYEDRDQRTLEQLDDASVMDALLALPTLTRNIDLAKRQRHTQACAYAIQRALVLELWLCAPYRIGALVSIKLDQIVSMRIDAIERVLLRAAKRQSVNKKAPEHFLNADTIALLRLYVDEYRPIILKCLKLTSSPHLLPGQSGNGKTKSALYIQMTNYVRKSTSLKEWHPHVMRKIVPKIALDEDPGALEVARRTGGWANDSMLREIYGQHVHRASQARYLELLEGRRLASVRTLKRSRRSVRKQ